jgi:hypothetical protein
MDGYPLFATIDMSLHNYKEKATVPWLLSISTPLTNPTSDGLTTPQEAEELNKWEDALEKEIAAETHFMWVWSCNLERASGTYLLHREAGPHQNNASISY